MQFFKAQSCLGKTLIAAGLLVLSLLSCCLCATLTSVIAPEREPTKTPMLSPTAITASPSVTTVWDTPTPMPSPTPSPIPLTTSPPPRPTTIAPTPMATPTMVVPSPMPTLTKASQLEMSFTFACPGDYWVIESKNIGLMIKPEIPTNKAQFVRNLITLIRPGRKVEIVDTGGFLGLWKRVYLYEGEAIVAEGWIMAETVAEAKRVEKGPLCP